MGSIAPICLIICVGYPALIVVVGLYVARK